ncbi:MAG: Flp pilus assembly complex ATPase component TadA [Planctomycetes bacterium]|nr:Flp pilus assembly complex ATPase component TadA [Planctomycetota bacterium]
MTPAEPTARTTPTREARQSLRWTPAFVAVVELRGDGVRARGEVVDLSDGGASVRFLADAIHGTLGVGARVVLDLHIRASVIERVARIAWVRGARELEVGFVFDATDPITLDLASVPIDPRQALRIPTAVALRRRVLPLCEWNGHVVTACADLGDPLGLEAVARALGRPVLPQPVDAAQLARTIMTVHGDPRLAAQTVETAQVGQLDSLVYAAWLRRASDLHVCPERDGVHLLLRVDGELEPFDVLPADAHAELLSRIKVQAGMDIAERRAPQDGRFTQELPGGQRVDVRVATLPTNHGERATLRLLAIDADSLTLANLGMSETDLRRCGDSLRRPHGMILATGPTGCGKTTTLFAALRAIIAERRVNAIALQEPVEYDIPGVSQVEIDTSQKISFASALRSIMRHDPDVIMIGEIRDAETASIAIKAALTGHLVLATLHTNSAASAITRLVDMGVERYLIAATLRLVVAQRLVRRLCPYCRREEPLSSDAAQLLRRPQAAGSRAFAARGCVFCSGRGFRGRLGLFELLELDGELCDRVRDGAHEADVERAARAKGVPALADDALAKLQSGATAVAPVFEAVDPWVPGADVTHA